MIPRCMPSKQPQYRQALHIIYTSYRGKHNNNKKTSKGKGDDGRQPQQQVQIPKAPERERLPYFTSSFSTAVTKCHGQGSLSKEGQFIWVQRSRVHDGAVNAWQEEEEAERLHPEPPSRKQKEQMNNGAGL